MSKTTVCLILLCVVALIVCLAICQWPHHPRHPPNYFSHAAVAADFKDCSVIGRNILQKGGSGVDAAIAALLCTSLYNAQSMGIGGGSIFTVMDSSGKVKIINSKEAAPKKVTSDLTESCSKSTHRMPDSKWIGVPGEIRGYEKAHKLYGKLPWADLFQPTIKLAREGFKIPEVQGGYLHCIDSNETQSLRKLYSDENGNLLKTGDIVKFEKLADTLEKIANQGADAFYTGGIAKDLVRDIQEAGGTLTEQDLAEYKVTVTDAWVVPLREYQMYIPPPPTGGAILSFILNVMKGYNLTPGMKGEAKKLANHRYIETLKFANGLKKDIHDLNFYPEAEKRAKNFTTESFANDIRRKITNRTHDPQYYNITESLDGVGTSHVSVVAEDGSAVAVTSSINDMFGSQLYSPRTGVILNNQLADFCGRRITKISSGERPPSNMAPTILKSKTKTLVIGASGGSYIPTGIASALMNHLWFGKSLKEAIAAPVIHVDSDSNVKFEPEFDKVELEDLISRGHNISKFFNTVQAVEKVDEYIRAVSDARKKGEPAGY